MNAPGDRLHDRSFPMNRRSPALIERPFRAISGCEQSQQEPPLFDHLVGNSEQRGWNAEPEHSGDLRVDDQFELRRLPDWQFPWLRTLEDAASESATLTIRVHEAGSIARQSANLDSIPYRIGCRKSMARCQCGQLDPPAGKESVRGDEQRIRPPSD